MILHFSFENTWINITFTRREHFPYLKKKNVNKTLCTSSYTSVSEIFREIDLKQKEYIHTHYTMEGRIIELCDKCVYGLLSAGYVLNI